MMTVQKSQNSKEISPWLERTRWLEHLQGQDLRKMAKLASITINSQSEKALSAICEAFKVCIHRTKKAILNRTSGNITVSHFDLRQINSFDRHVPLHKRPMLVEVQDATLNSYIRVWQKLLCYLIRTSSYEGANDEGPLILYKLNNDQTLQLRHLLTAAHRLVKIPVSDVAYAYAAKELEIRCVQMSIGMLDHVLHGNEHDNVLVSFLAVNGIDSDKGMFKDVQNCTPDLSALIKIAQFLVIRQAMYDMEGERADHLDTTIEEMRLKFMVRDGRTPVDWILGLRAFGKRLAESKTVDGSIIWSDDLQTVSYKGFETTMKNFKGFVAALVEKLRKQLAELFLIQSDEELAEVAPSPRLYATKDLPREAREGWSFLMDERNEHLFDGSTWMVDRILGNTKLFDQFLLKKSNKPSWRGVAVVDYLNKVSAFLETLWILVYLTGGQPPRASELLTVRYCNTLQGEHRNMFMEEGLISIVTSYHKGYNMEGSTKIIHRFLPKDISEIMVLYLWLILPFKQFLESTRSTSKAPPSAFIWGPTKGSVDRKKWDSDRVCAALKRESIEILKSELQIRTSRQVIISMARKHIRGASFTAIQTPEDEIWDLQAAHTSNVAGSIYARGLHDAPGVIENKREEFRRISQRWHLFLGFETWRTGERNKRPCAFDEMNSANSDEGEEEEAPVERVVGMKRRRVI